jgi:hypothetical protein
MNRNQVAAKVSENKLRHPERYCAAPRCLWSIASGPCPRHRNQRHAIQLGTVQVAEEVGELSLPDVEPPAPWEADQTAALNVAIAVSNIDSVKWPGDELPTKTEDFIEREIRG